MTTPEYERDHDMELSFYSEDMEEEEEFFQTIANPLKKNIDLDVFMASSAHAKPWINTTAEHLSKVFLSFGPASKVPKLTHYGVV